MDDKWLFRYEFLRTLRYTAICLMLVPSSLWVTGAVIYRHDNSEITGAEERNRYEDRENS